MPKYKNLGSGEAIQVGQQAVPPLGMEVTDRYYYDPNLELVSHLPAAKSIDCEQVDVVPSGEMYFAEDETFVAGPFPTKWLATRYSDRKMSLRSIHTGNDLTAEVKGCLTIDSGEAFSFTTPVKPLDADAAGSYTKEFTLNDPVPYLFIEVKSTGGASDVTLMRLLV